MPFALCLPVFLALAAGPTDHLARGKAAMESLDYDRAAEELTIAAARDGAPLDERVEANLYAGIAHRILGRDVDAKLNFVFVLRHAPQTELPPGTPPKIKNFYDLIRLELSPPASTVAPPASTAPPDDATPTSTAPSEDGAEPSASNASATEPGPQLGADATGRSTDASETGSPFPIFPSILVATGAAALVGGLGTAFFFDGIVANPDARRDAKEGATFGGFTALTVAGLGLGAAGVGSSLLLWSALE